MFLANNQGYGIAYGRSVPVHGDGTALEVLSSAFAEGLMKEEEKDTALAFILSIMRKMFDFWYDGERGCFNMWWDGRGHDSYRPLDRILETNLDRINHFFMQLKNYEAAGVADTEIIATVPVNDTWQAYNVDFVADENDVKKTVFLKRSDTVAMIPFVGFGAGWGNHSAYYPFPAIPGALEASPSATYPFMIPEYTDEGGEKYRPTHYYSDIKVTEGNDTVEIIVRGNLITLNGKAPVKTDKCYTMSFLFQKNTVTMKIRTDDAMESAQMISAVINPNTKVNPIGFNASEDIDTAGKEDFCGIHGPLINAKLHTANDTKELGYTPII